MSYSKPTASSGRDKGGSSCQGTGGARVGGGCGEPLQEGGKDLGLIRYGGFTEG